MAKSVKQPQLLVSTDLDEKAWRESVVEFCKANKLEIPELGTEKSFEFTREMIDDDIYCFFDNLDFSKIKDADFVITGTLGLWHGIHEFDSTPVINGLEKAIKRCLGRDIEDYDIKLNKGVIEVAAHHHDGTNHFEIRKLGKRAPQMIKDKVGTLFYGEVKDYWFEKIKINDIF